MPPGDDAGLRSAGSVPATDDAAAPPERSADAGSAERDEARPERSRRWLLACGSDASAHARGATSAEARVPSLRTDAPETPAAAEPIRRALHRGAREPLAVCAARARGVVSERGRVALTRLVVSPAGGFESVELQEGTGDLALDRCLVAALSRAPTPSVSEARVTLSNVPIVLCSDGRIRVWPALPGARAPR